MGEISVKTIFIVDDDEMLRMALEDYLERNGSYQIHCFTTGEECIQHLHLSPDVIILDYFLNSIDKNAATGLETMQTIKKKHHKIHFIMLSGQDRYGIALETLQKGAEQYVIKDEEAFAKIAEMLDAMV